MNPASPRLSIAAPLPRLPLELAERGRRRERRYALHAKVRLMAPREAIGTTLNASTGGLRVALACVELPVGAVCTLELTLESGRMVRRHARVVWTQRCRDGVVAGLAYVTTH